MRHSMERPEGHPLLDWPREDLVALVLLGRNYIADLETTPRGEAIRRLSDEFGVEPYNWLWDEVFARCERVFYSRSGDCYVDAECFVRFINWVDRSFTPPELLLLAEESAAEALNDGAPPEANSTS